MSNQPQRPNNSNQPPRKTPKFSLSWVYAIIFMVLMFLFMKNPSEEGVTRKISYSEFKEYGGTVDVGEYPDETASTEPIIHKGVLLSAATNNEGGFLIVPTLFSDVTIFMDAATKYAYIVNFSHVNIINLTAHTETTIGVTET